MNDAHAYEMQVQIWKPNTWGVIVCKKNTGDLYWFRLKNALCLVREERSILSCTEVLVVGVTSECERGRGSQVSSHEWSAHVCVALLEPSQGLGELCDHVIV
jgi:hypothetical protein